MSLLAGSVVVVVGILENGDFPAGYGICMQDQITCAFSLYDVMQSRSAAFLHGRRLY